MKDVRGSGREEVMLRICSEFLEMPGLRLTCRQAQRLFGAGEHTCAVLDELVQASLLPARAPAVPGYDIAGLNLPTWDIGGDYFDYFPLPDGRLGLVIADVSGKGLPAALLMATFRAALRTEVRTDRTISPDLLIS